MCCVLNVLSGHVLQGGSVLQFQSAQDLRDIMQKMQPKLTAEQLACFEDWLKRLCRRRGNRMRMPYDMDGSSRFYLAPGRSHGRWPCPCQ